MIDMNCSFLMPEMSEKFEGYHPQRKH